MPSSSRVELQVVADLLNMAYVPRQPGGDFHPQHEQSRLLHKAVDEHPDLFEGCDVRGWVAVDANGGGVYTAGCTYIDTGDSCELTITFRVEDPWSPHIGEFRVECWMDVAVDMQAFADDWKVRNEFSKWKEYIAYVHQWADDHANDGYRDDGPDRYSEWVEWAIFEGDD